MINYKLKYLKYKKKYLNLSIEGGHLTEEQIQNLHEGKPLNDGLPVNDNSQESEKGFLH